MNTGKAGNSGKVEKWKNRNLWRSKACSAFAVFPVFRLFLLSLCFIFSRFPPYPASIDMYPFQLAGVPLPWPWFKKLPFEENPS